MFGFVKWWIVWAVKGLKLALLLVAGLAAAGAVYMGWLTISMLGWEMISKLQPHFGLEPLTRKVFATAWQLLGHSLQLAMFAYVVVNWFPEFFAREVDDLILRRRSD